MGGQLAGCPRIVIVARGSHFKTDFLSFEAKGLLIGESANNEVNQEIHAIAASYPGIEHVNEVLTLHMGPGFILVNMSIDFVDQISAAEVEQTIAAIDQEIKAKNLLVKRVFIEAESRRIFANKPGVID